jgi:DNA-damage-inducible protein J
MQNSVSYTFRMDQKDKLESEYISKKLGMNLSTALNVLIKEYIRVGGFPFQVKINEEEPNLETIEAMIEAKKIGKDSTVKGYDNMDEILRELKR